jgi:argininosuccinate lyase
VALAEEKGKGLNQLSVAELRSVDKAFGPDAPSVFNLDQAMSRRHLTGSPGTKEVRKQLEKWRTILR